MITILIITGVIFLFILLIKAFTKPSEPVHEDEYAEDNTHNYDDAFEYRREGSPFNMWCIGNLQAENRFVPWREVFNSQVIYPGNEFDKHKDFLEQVLEQMSFALDDDLVVVYHKSPEHAWEHLAGSEGYLFISKEEKKQIEYIRMKIG